MDEEDHLESQIANLDYLELLYQIFQTHSPELDPSWTQFFKRFKEAEVAPSPVLHLSSRGDRILQLIEAYRKHGHLLAAINPLVIERPSDIPQLDLGNLGFLPNERDELFPTLGLCPEAETSLKNIEDKLKKHYCQTVSFEFKEFTEPALEAWIQQNIETGAFAKPFSPKEKKTIFNLLAQSEMLEAFLHTKHVGKKRFSLEGADTLIPMLFLMIAKGAQEGIEEIVIGMSHRGRLNVLANILNKPLALIFKDFDDDYEPTTMEGMGDIRYHKGHANELLNTYYGKPIRLSLTPNPSHLESVYPVVEGQTHAKQFLLEDESNRNRIIPLLMHGDAALSGQGVVYETIQMRKLEGFETGGTLHIVINNQIGFTTSPKEGRSTLYCTDIAHAFGAPVLHVNAEDPETCIRAAIFALEIRQRFNCDVFLDLNCYRKYGHNEGDEPAFTQPFEYNIIRKKKSISSLYLNQLLAEGVMDKKNADEIEQNIKQNFSEVYLSDSSKDARS